MINLDAYTHDQHGQILEAHCIDSKPSDLKELDDFPESSELFDYSKPLTILADYDWLLCHLVAYALTEGYQHIRVSKCDPITPVCIYDFDHYSNEGNEYGKTENATAEVYTANSDLLN